MRHLVFFTQPAKINPRIRDKAPADVQDGIVLALDASELINTRLAVACDLTIHIKSDDTTEKSFTAFVNSLPGSDKVAIVYHDRTCAEIQAKLLDEAWFGATVPEVCKPAEHGHHSYMADGSHEGYWALAEYLAFHLLDREPRIELLEGVWMRFQ